MKFVKLVVASLLLVSGLAAAQNKGYAELQYYDEDGLLLYHPRAYEELLSSNLPQSIKDDLISIESNIENTKDPLTNKKFSYKLKMIPQDSKIYRTITSVYGVTPKKIIKQTR
jgi:RecG-like helicase